MRQLIIGFLLVCCMAGLVSCGSDFKPDPVDPRLPSYTEKGNNITGALINDQVWRGEQKCFWSCKDEMSFDYFENDFAADSLQIILRGRFIKDEEDGAYISFILKGFEREADGDIPNLAGVYVLDDVLHKGKYHECYAQKGRLEIHFDQRIDNGNNVYRIIAGTFGLYVENDDCGMTTIEYGRFDMKF